MIKLVEYKFAPSVVSVVIFTVFCSLFSIENIDAQARRNGQTKKPVIAQTRRAKKTVDENLTPVVLIHGIGGSDLRRVIPESERAQNRNLLDDGFPHDVLKMKINPFGKATDPRNLQFDETGAPRSDTASKTIQATEFYDVPFSRNITDLSKYLEAQGYKKSTGDAVADKAATLFEFYYDFRYSVPQTAMILSEFVNRVKLQTGAPQIDLIGHSMGGVIVKQYLSTTENANNIRTVIFAATPHLGAPKALKALRYGDDLDIGLFDECKLKRAVHNMPSMFNLLPGKRYFQIAGAYFNDASDTDNDGVTGELDYEHTINNLKNGAETKCKLNADGKNQDAAPYDKLSSDLIRDNVENFRDAQDNWTKPKDVKVFAVAGFNVPTLKSIKEDRAQMTYTYTTAGDGTVPLLSGESVDADAIYYADFKQLKTDHSQMIGTPAIDLQIYKLLTTGAGIYAANISTKRPDDEKFTTTPKIERFFKLTPNRAAKRTLKSRKN